MSNLMVRVRELKSIMSTDLTGVDKVNKLIADRTWVIVERVRIDKGKVLYVLGRIK